MSCAPFAISWWLQGGEVALEDERLTMQTRLCKKRASRIFKFGAVVTEACEEVIHKKEILWRSRSAACDNRYKHGRLHGRRFGGPRIELSRARNKVTLTYRLRTYRGVHHWHNLRLRYMALGAVPRGASLDVFWIGKTSAIFLSMHRSEASMHIVVNMRISNSDFVFR